MNNYLRSYISPNPVFVLSVWPSSLFLTISYSCSSASSSFSQCSSTNRIRKFLINTQDRKNTYRFYRYKLLLHIKDIGKAIRREITLFWGMESEALKESRLVVEICWLRFKLLTQYTHTHICLEIHSVYTHTWMNFMYVWK